MNNKRVLILVNHDIVIYNFRKELVEQLINNNYEVYISSPYGYQIDKLVKIGAKYIETSVDRRGINPFKDFKLLMKYRKIIRCVKPLVVLTYTIKPNIFGGMASRLTKTPFITNITGLGSAVEKKGLLQLITMFLYRKALKKANVVYFQNKENMMFMLNRKIVDKNKFLLPGSGVNLDHFRPLPYPSDIEGLNFLFIGRLLKEKGIDLYLEAARLIKQKYPKTSFHVLGFGDSSYVKKIEKYQNKNLIIYHGRKDDVRDFHRLSHCLIHPSYYPEGMSNVLLESAACARPIITTNRSGCKEIVDEDKNGFLVEVNNLDDLVLKIEKFINLEYRSKIKMGLNGREKVERQFDRNIVVDSYLDKIERIRSDINGL